MADPGGRVLPRALRAALPLYAGLAVTYGAAFAFKALLVQEVFSGPGEMAVFETLDRFSQGLVTIGLLGLPSGVLRVVRERPERARTVLPTAVLLCFLASGVLVVLVHLLPGAVAAAFGEVDPELVEGFAFRALQLACVAIVGALLLATGRIARRGALDASERVASLAALVVLVFLVGGRNPLWGAATALFVGATLSVVLALVLLRGVGLSRMQPVPAVPVARELLRTGAFQWTLSILEALRPLLLLALALHVLGANDTGLLATAMAFSLPLIVLPDLAAQALFPKMLGPQGEGAHVEGERRRLFREVAVAGAVGLAAYGALAAWLLPMAREGKYADAVVPLLILLPGVLAHGLSAHTGYVLLVRDKLAYAAGASAAALAASLALAWALMPSLGATGGAIALTAGLLLRTGLYQLAARKP